MHITSKNIAKVPTGCVRTHFWKAPLFFLVVSTPGSVPQNLLSQSASKSSVVDASQG